MKKYSILLLLIPIVLFASAQDDVDHRVQPEDLNYIGAFKLPDESSADYVKTWNYGGHSMAYYPYGDPNGPDDGYPGSIFATGHAWEHQISEISIPVPIISQTKNVEDLNTATTLQPFHDID